MIVDLPPKWRLSRFRDVLATDVRNGIYKPAEFHGNGAKVVNMGELFGHPRLRAIPMRRLELSDGEISRFGLHANDLLFARRSLVAEGAGKCSIVLDIDEPTVFESSIIRARPDPEIADPLFLYYLWSSPIGVHLLGTIRRQVAVSGITGKDLEQLEIPLPPPAEQREISKVLSALDDKIEQNARTARALERLARTIFRAWFVDFEPVKAKSAGATFFPSMPQSVFDALTTKLVDSEINTLPEGWEVKPLLSVCSLVSGGTPKRSVPAYWGGDIAWYSVKDAPADGEVWVIDTDEKITSDGVANSAARIVPKGCTIISARGTVGKLAMAGMPMAFNQSCYGLLPGDGTSFCHLYLLMQTAVADLQQRTHGSVFETITRPTFDGLMIVNPPRDIVLAFEAVVAPLFDVLLSLLQESAKISELRDYLLPRLISGGVRMEVTNG
ncbi:restriction endonuclease subunit S [Robbsia andropogonis]|uniref:restriction endonuclease subunit S n=1 Tax=Robbsia andropogonis TaxID=28092 RepID=UPI0004B079E7|nr:restriction endonuclease subunit S [Robbsia andropogonis]